MTGGYEGNAFGECWHDVMNVHDMTWVHMLLGGVKRVHDACATGVKLWACSRSLEWGKYGKIRGLGLRGSSRGHEERWLSGTFTCGGSECNVTASNVPKGNSNYQRRAGAFSGDLMQDWGYVHVKDVIWDRFEVLERLPWMEGASCNCWPTWFGGSNRLSR